MGNRGPIKGTGGRPKKPLHDKLLEGDTNITALTTPDDVELVGADMPAPKDYMQRQQKGGIELHAREIFENTWTWLKRYNCEKLVTEQNLEQYAMAAARWIQAEEAVSMYGMLAKHPTTSAPITSPYVGMSMEYSKHANVLWNQIYMVVKDNCTTAVNSYNPQGDMMERLLTMRSRL